MKIKAITVPCAANCDEWQKEVKMNLIRENKNTFKNILWLLLKFVFSFFEKKNKKKTKKLLNQVHNTQFFSIINSTLRIYYALFENIWNVPFLHVLLRKLRCLAMDKWWPCCDKHSKNKFHCALFLFEIF